MGAAPGRAARGLQGNRAAARCHWWARPRLAPPPDRDRNRDRARDRPGGGGGEPGRAPLGLAGPYGAGARWAWL